jgi:hypothetical protein
MAEPHPVDGAPGHSSVAVVVTERMIGSAAAIGDLENLMIWATQGVRVTSGEPLVIAAAGGYLDVLRCLVRELGADVNQTGLGVSPLHMAISRGDLAVVRCLVQLGAAIGTMNDDGDTALLMSAQIASFPTVHYLLEEGGANMDDVNNDGETIWDLLTERLENAADTDDEEEAGGVEDPVSLADLLRVMVLRGAPPPTLLALLSPESVRVVQEGARLRARLPAYLAHRRAYLDTRCPRISLLPGVLRALIYTCEGPATTEELWATGLGTAL